MASSTAALAWSDSKGAPARTKRSRAAGRCLQTIVSLRLVPTKDNRRLPAVEILRVTGAIRDCLHAGQMTDLPELIGQGRELHAMQLFDQHLLDLVHSGRVAMEAAIHASSNPEELERALRVE